MATTQAQAAVMGSVGKKFDDTNTELHGMLKRLMSELEMLRDQWQGAGGRSFSQVKEQWARDQDTLQRALGETAQAIRTAGQQYTLVDTDASNRFGGQHRGQPLPL